MSDKPQTTRNTIQAVYTDGRSASSVLRYTWNT